MHTFAEKPRTTQQTTRAKSTIPGRTHIGQSPEVNSTLHFQRAIGNQATQRPLQKSAGRAGESSRSTDVPPFGNDSQVRACMSATEPVGLQSWDSLDPEQVEGAEEIDQVGGVPSPPIAPPAPPVAPPLPAPAAPFTVTVPAHIRSASTPIGMPDRLPPRVNTPALIDINGWHPPMQDVRISVEGTGGGNGSVTINGANSVDLITSATVQLRGVNQTDPGNAGRLRLVARQGTTLLGSSAGFSVSSITQNFRVTFHSQISTATMRGLAVNTFWESDSGNVADLDQVEFSEQVQYGAATGIWAGVVGGDNSGYLPANHTPLTDRHSTPLARFTGPGSRVAEQTFTLNDRRTGAVDIPATRSGFRLTRTAIVNAAGRIEFTVDKRGAATSANGFASAAGAGSVTRTQVI